MSNNKSLRKRKYFKNKLSIYKTYGLAIVFILFITVLADAGQQTVIALKIPEVISTDSPSSQSMIISNKISLKRALKTANIPFYDADLQHVTVETDPIDDDFSYNTEEEEEEVEEDLGKVEGKYYNSGTQIKNYSRTDKKNYQKDSNYYKSIYGKVEAFASPELLAKQAKAIQTYANTNTTIFTVALIDKNRHVKKFVFHNNDGVMAPHLRKAAKDLGYDVIKAEQSHAEGQFLQFLCERNKDDKIYTHILAMGCSRPHCNECNLILQLLLGNQYYEVTAAAKVVHNNIDFIETVKNEDLTYEADYYAVKTQKAYFKILRGKKAISNKDTPNYYIPNLLKILLEERLFTSLELKGKYKKGVDFEEE